MNQFQKIRFFVCKWNLASDQNPVDGGDSNYQDLTEYNLFKSNINTTEVV